MESQSCYSLLIEDSFLVLTWNDIAYILTHDDFPAVMFYEHKFVRLQHDIAKLFCVILFSNINHNKGMKHWQKYCSVSIQRHFAGSTYLRVDNCENAIIKSLYIGSKDELYRHSCHLFVRTTRQQHDVAMERIIVKTYKRRHNGPVAKSFFTRIVSRWMLQIVWV